MLDRETDSSDAAPTLAIWPCQSSCEWQATGTVWTTPTGADMPLFTCAGCGSQWVRSEGWTPIDAQGVVPAAVAAERRRHA